MSENETSGDEILEGGNAPVARATTAPITLDGLLRNAADTDLTEDLALALLKRADLHPEVLEQLAKNANPLKSRKVRIALASHPNTPRHVSLPLARQFYTFDLMKVALSPRVPADVRVAVDNILISRLKAVTVGERLTLARRASGRVAAALLFELDNPGDKNANTAVRKTRVMEAALDSPRLTEALVIGSVSRPVAPAELVHAVAKHAKWSGRKEIRAALLRTEHLSLARALEFSGEIPAELLQEILDNSRLPAKIKRQLLRESEKRPLPGS